MRRFKSTGQGQRFLAVHAAAHSTAMPLIVSDSNCLIGLRKASLLAAFLGLPYEVLMPDALWQEVTRCPSAAIAPSITEQRASTCIGT